jgi:hypothetical protein
MESDVDFKKSELIGMGGPKTGGNQQSTERTAMIDFGIGIGIDK